MADVMEVDDVVQEKLHVWFLPGVTKNNSTLQLTNLDLKTLTVDNLKKLILDKELSLLVENIGK